MLHWNFRQGWVILNLLLSLLHRSSTDPQRHLLPLSLIFGDEADQPVNQLQDGIHVYNSIAYTEEAWLCCMTAVPCMHGKFLDSVALPGLYLRVS